MASQGTAAQQDHAPAALSVVCRYWAELDLESMRAKLDDAGLKIASFQEEAMQNRRKLAESTREFKRIATEAAITGVGPLLKQYQEEIDRLSKRSKHSETAFLELYQKLYEAPDPAPALAIALETASRVADLDAQCKKVTHELAEYKAEATNIKNQDLTIRKLEDKVRTLEAALEEKGLEVHEVRAQAIAEADAARMAQMQERELQLTAMLAEAHSSLATMQKLHTATQNQLFAIQSQSEDERTGRQAELELASLELDRAQERLAALEREKQRLQNQLVSASQPGPAQDAGLQAGGLPGAAGPGLGASSSVEDTLRQELHAQREVAARLRLEVVSLRQELEQVSSMWEARVEGLRDTLRATEEHGRAMEEQLSMRPTNQQVEELRAQIRLLQAVGYNAVMDEDGPSSSDAPSANGAPGSSTSASMAGGGQAGAAANGSSGGGEGWHGRPPQSMLGSLEAMLLQKNRHLEHELTMARLRLVDSKGQMDAAAAQVTELEVQLASKQALVDRLEEDLMASRRAMAAPAKAKGGKDSQLTSLLPSPGPATSSSLGDGEGGEEEGGAESSMLRVVCGQRDRFRAKAMELEEELSRVKADLASARSQAAAAKADNIALVERLRYVHGFKAQQRTGAGSGAAGDVEVGADAEKRYGRMYEERINPFKEFQGEQRERQKSNLHVADKLMYMFGQLVFGSQGARLGTFVYLVILHLLVVGSLMRMTHHSSAQLYDHTQNILDSRHDIATVMHHEGPVGKMLP